MSNKITTIKKINPITVAEWCGTEKRADCIVKEHKGCPASGGVFHLPTSVPGFSSIRAGENPAVISLKLLHFIHINQDQAYALLHQLNTVKYVSICCPPALSIFWIQQRKTCKPGSWQKLMTGHDYEWLQEGVILLSCTTRFLFVFPFIL